MKYVFQGLAGFGAVAAMLTAVTVPARAEIIDMGLGRFVEVTSPVPYAAEPFPLEQMTAPKPTRPYTAYVPPDGDHRLELAVRRAD